MTNRSIFLGLVFSILAIAAIVLSACTGPSTEPSFSSGGDESQVSESAEETSSEDEHEEGEEHEDEHDEGAIPPTVVTPPPSSVLESLGPDLVGEGRELYQQVCSACHGLEGEGYSNELGAPALDASEHGSHHPDQQIHDWILNGKPGLERQMPAFSGSLEDREVHAIIAFLHTFWTPEQLQVQQDLSRRWPATPEPTWTATP